MFGEPTFVARHHARHAQRETLFGQQSVAAVARTVTPNLARFGKMNDVAIVGIARPGHVGFALFQGRAQRMNAPDKSIFLAQWTQNRVTATRRQSHGQSDIRRIGNFDADARDARIERPQTKRDYEHGAAFHAAVEQAQHLNFHLARVAPVIGRPRFDGPLGTDESAIFHARDIARIAARQIRIGPQFGVKRMQRARFDHLRGEHLILFVRAVAPMDVFGATERDFTGDPIEESFVVGEFERKGNFHVLMRVSVGDEGVWGEIGVCAILCPMYEPQPKQNWSADFDTEKAKFYLGKHLLFGISYLDHEEKLLRQEQGHGEIFEITAEVIAVRFHNSEEIATLPPFVNELKAAPPGEYKLRSTGEVVSNPDLIGQFLCIAPKL